MTRTLAFIAAVLLAGALFTTSGLAHPSAEDIRFTLTPAHRAGEFSLALRSGGEHRKSNLASSFRASELAGLDVARLHAGGPLSFALVRDAGRVDCAGTAAGARAEGRCRFSQDAGFAAFLASQGMARPSVEQAYHLTLVEARRDLVQALRAAGYSMPSIDDYLAMSAVGVTPAYIADLARAGYRPAEADELIQFRALNVTPDYLAALARAGYARLPADTVVKLAALKIDPEFIRGFERIGYRNLPVDDLVQLKALNVTPEFVQSVRRDRNASPTVDQLVRLKAIGVAPRARRR